MKSNVLLDETDLRLLLAGQTVVVPPELEDQHEVSIALEDIGHERIAQAACDTNPVLGLLAESESSRIPTRRELEIELATAAMGVPGILDQDTDPEWVGQRIRDIASNLAGVLSDEGDTDIRLDEDPQIAAADELAEAAHKLLSHFQTENGELTGGPPTVLSLALADYVQKRGIAFKTPSEDGGKLHEKTVGEATPE